jgi:hypothetical protein
MKNLFGAGSGRKEKKRFHHSAPPRQTRQNLPSSWFARFTLKNSMLFVLIAGAAVILAALVASIHLYMLVDNTDSEISGEEMMDPDEMARRIFRLKDEDYDAANDRKERAMYDELRKMGSSVLVLVSCHISNVG